MKDRLFLDTNVMLDLLGERVPYYDPMAKIATLADKNQVKVIVSALSYSTVFYVLSKFEKRDKVIEKLQKFRMISGIASLDEKIVDASFTSGFTDFEDALQYFCSLKSNCNILITRNAKDFKKSDIPLMTAKEYLAANGMH